MLLKKIGLIVLFKNEQLDKVFDFGQELKEINLSVYMVRTGSAERLFNDSSPISVARGFDIAGNIKETEKDTGIDYNDRFFELFAAYKNGEYYGMPILKAENEKIIIDGEEICKGRQTRERLSNEESLIYSFLINKNSGGKIYFGKEYADVSQCRVDYKNKKYSPHEDRFDENTIKTHLISMLNYNADDASNIFSRNTDTLRDAAKSIEQNGFEVYGIYVKACDKAEARRLLTLDSISYITCGGMTE